MSWADDFSAGTYQTKTSSISGGMLTYYNRNFLTTVKNALRVAPYGQRRNIPAGEGKTIQFFRYNNIATSISSRKLTEGVNPTATQITGQNLSATLQEWGGFSQHSSLLKRSHIDRNLQGITSLWGEDAATTIDLLCQMELAANGAYPYRCDGNNSGADAYSFAGTVDAGSSTTTLVDAAFSSNTDYGDTNDDANQSVIIITSGTGYGQMRAVTDFVTSSGTFTVAPAWDVTPAAGDTYVVVGAHGLDSSDLLTTANIRNAVKILRNNKSQPISGGFYVGILCPDTEAGLKSDTNWVNVMQYKDTPMAQTQGLFNGEIGMWGGVRWVSSTLPFRFPITTVGTAGSSYGVGAMDPANASYTNYSASGDVYATFILGREAFGVSTFTGDASSILKPGIIVKTPGPNDTSNPLNRYSTVGWVLPFIAKGLNPMFAVQMWSGG